MNHLEIHYVDFGIVQILNEQIRARLLVKAKSTIYVL